MLKLSLVLALAVASTAALAGEQFVPPGHRYVAPERRYVPPPRGRSDVIVVPERRRHYDDDVIIERERPHGPRLEFELR